MESDEYVTIRTKIDHIVNPIFIQKLGSFILTENFRLIILRKKAIIEDITSTIHTNDLDDISNIVSEGLIRCGLCDFATTLLCEEFIEGRKTDLSDDLYDKVINIFHDAIYIIRDVLMTCLNKHNDDNVRHRYDVTNRFLAI